MNFVNILKNIVMIAGQSLPSVISIVDPPLGAVAGTVLNAVLQAEAKIGPGNGDKKKLDAMTSIQVAIPVILLLVKQTTGKDLADADKLSSGIEKMNDAIVDILNAFRVLPKP